MKALLFIVVLLVVVLISGFQYGFAVTEKAQKTDIAALAKDPKFVQSIIEYMKSNHPFTQDVITSMLKDPMLRIQMLGHMSENKDAMKLMNQMMSGNNTVMKNMKMDHSKMSMDGMKMSNMKTDHMTPMTKPKK